MLHLAQVAALILLGLCLIGGAAPGLASGVAGPPVIRIPADHPLPEAGARVVVPVPPGGEIHFEPDSFDPADATPSLDGADLILEFADGGALVLQDFFASVTPPAALVLGDAVISAEELLASLADADEMSRETIGTAAAGPTAGGGGELFGLVQVISWLIDRIDPVSDAAAAEPLQVAESVDFARFAQLEAQLRIARAGEIAKLAAAYESATAALLAGQVARLEGGGGSAADVAQARAFNLDAQIESHDAAFRLVRAVDAHQDAYGERLESAVFPVWSSPPPGELAAITSAVPADRQAAARGYWRQARHAGDTVRLLETLSVVAAEVRDAYRQQFEVAQRSLLDVEFAEKTLFQAQLRLTERRADLLVAEAWLLAALGRLPADHIKHPGWQ